MIDTGKMLESVERLERVFGGETRATQSIGEVRELLVNLRQAEKDAARYRWLRDELEQSQGGIALFDGSCHVCDIDLFIDEAMQCK